MEIKFENLNVVEFISFLKTCELKKFPQLLEFEGDKIQSKSHESKNLSVIKYHSIDTNKILKFKNIESKKLLFPLISLEKILSILEIYKNSGEKEVNGIFNCKDINHLEEKNDFVVNGLKLKAKSLNIEVKTTEFYMVSIDELNNYINQPLWNKLSDTSVNFVNFTFSSVLIKKLKSLIKLNNNNLTTPSFVIEINSKDNKITFKNSFDKPIWDISYEENLVIDPTFTKTKFCVNSKMLNVIDNENENHSAYIINNPSKQKFILVLKENENSQYFTGLTEE